ncbi:tetratricopeptide repeat protein [Fodinibius sediminis]|nr:tetratricopeptide repeat protein [Fodinibius sediminis]
MENSQFVGDKRCASCHSEQVADWKGSHHDYAMKKATDESVRARFDDTTFEHHGTAYRFFKKDSLFMVEAPGPGGERIQYQVTHTFGWEPLQQYLIDFGKGKLQALNIAWDTQKEQWFAMNPEEDIQHGDWLHWTGGAMNWNTMCADCHSTNLQQNYIAEADSFHTTWSSINVSCEACHGPGKQHVDFVESEAVEDATIERIRRDLELTRNTPQTQQINQCAQCHALREDLTDDYRHSGDFLDHYSPTLPHPDSYFPDGQIKEEVYVYGSFLQSKMFEEKVKCNDCHDPHSLKLKANVTDNSLCMQCHEPRYNTVEHHKHQVNTEASQCINCHMPGRYYMEVDFRRDHSFRVPRPDLSVGFDTPNACNNCHDQESAQWAADAVEKWYGPQRPEHFSEIFTKADREGADILPELAQLVVDTLQPDIVRATAVWYAGQFPSSNSRDLLEKTINDPSPLVRNSTSRALANFPESLKNPVLQDALDDSVRAVRIGAVGGLAEFSTADIAFNLKQPFKQALEEYKRYLDVSRYFPQGQMNRGQFFEKRGQVTKAIDAYQKALEKDPYFNPARINLAYLYNRQGNNAEAEQLLKKVISQEPDYGPAHYSLALLLAEERKLEATLPHFKKAAALMPQNTRVRYNWAISLQQLGKPNQAEEAYLQAIDLAPDNPEYRYGISTLYVQQEQYHKALPHARKLTELQPNNRQFRQLQQMIEKRLGDQP